MGLFQRRSTGEKSRLHSVTNFDGLCIPSILPAASTFNDLCLPSIGDRRLSLFVDQIALADLLELLQIVLPIEIDAVRIFAAD